MVRLNDLRVLWPWPESSETSKPDLESESKRESVEQFRILKSTEEVRFSWPAPLFQELFFLLKACEGFFRTGLL